jgi:D-alanine-D-alanine ligase
LRVGLLFGGASVEHEVSVRSARSVASALSKAGHECVPIGVDGSGRWLSTVPSEWVLASGASRVDDARERDDRCRVAIAPGGGLVTLAAEGCSAPLDLDVLFPVLHGWGGEDGRLQGALDLAGIPCVGAGVLGSAVGMDKEASKRIFSACGLPVAPWRTVRQRDYEPSKARTEREILDEIGLPLFVKPANGGSSVGVTKVADAAALGEAISTGFRYDRKVLVEAGIDAREIECAVLGDDDPQPSIVGEILPSREFYDYAAKYLDDTSRLLIPAPLDAGTAETVRRLAVAAVRALDVWGMARVDFFVERRGERVFVNELNTLPGFTSISMYPKLWEASGIPFEDLVSRLLELALSRAAEERRRATRWRE